MRSLNSTSSASLYLIVGPFSWFFCESNTDRVKSGSYLIFLSVLVLGITNFTGLAGSFGAGLAGKGGVAVLATWGVGAVTTGFCTGSFTGVFVAMFLVGAVLFFKGCGVACFLVATTGFTGFAGCLAGGFAVFEGRLAAFKDFTGFAGALATVFLAGILLLAGAGFMFFFGGRCRLLCWHGFAFGLNGGLYRSFFSRLYCLFWCCLLFELKE